MPQFPKRESDIIALLDSMIGGYTENPAVFPGANLAALQSKRAAFQAAKDDKIEKQAQAQLATEAKEGALTDVKALMMNQLKQSELDTADDPEKLGLIHWGAKRPAQPSAPPGQPRNLEAIVQESGTLLLRWKVPAPGTGSRVRTYLIQRREQPTGGGKFNDWHQIGIALKKRITLTEEPRGQQLEYRIIAVNTGGNSLPSNTAAVVL